MGLWATCEDDILFEANVTFGIQSQSITRLRRRFSAQLEV